MIKITTNNLIEACKMYIHDNDVDYLRIRASKSLVTGEIKIVVVTDLEYE